MDIAQGPRWKDIAKTGHQNCMQKELSVGGGMYVTFRLQITLCYI